MPTSVIPAAPSPASAPIAAAAKSRSARQVLSLIGLLVILSFSLSIRLQLAPTDAHPDQVFFQRWADTLVRDGPFTVYRYSDANHPPLSLALFYILGNIYHAGGGDVSHPEAVREIALRDMLKIPGILFDMFLIVGAYWLTRREAGPLWALIPAVAIAFNPLVIMDSSVWGQTDSIVTVFTILGIGALYKRRYGLAWFFYGLALLARFQAITLLPLMVSATLFPRLGINEHSGHIFSIFRDRIAWKRLFIGLRTAALTILIWMTPYWLFSGQDAWRPFTEAVDHAPDITLYAYNFWWWATNGYGNCEAPGSKFDCTFMPDLCTDARTFPGTALSFKGLGLAMFGLYALIVSIRTATMPWVRNEYLVAGALTVAFFMLPTQIHDRYIYPAVPLFALALIRAKQPGDAQLDWRAIIPYVGFTITGQFNLMVYFTTMPYMPIHDFFHQVIPGGREEITVINLALFFITLLLVLWPTRLRPGARPSRELAVSLT